MGRNSADYIHAIVEGAKLAYADRDKYVADPAFVQVPVDRLISKDYAADLARRLRDKLKANEGSSNADRDGTGDTVFLGVVDKDGNAVSMIQSLFAAFGSGRMLAAAVREAGNKDVTVKEFPTLNHLFLPSTTGSFNEYSHLATNKVPDEVLDILTDWVKARIAVK